jgi:hypothetical protein
MKRRRRDADTHKEDGDGHGFPAAKPVDAPGVENLTHKGNSMREVFIVMS